MSLRAKKQQSSNELLTEALKQAQAIATFEASGLNHHYRVQKDDGAYTLNKIPHHGSLLDEREPSYRATEDTLIAFTYADLLSSGARGNFRPDTSVVARTPRPELIKALETLNFLSVKSPLYNLRGWGIHDDSAGRSAARTARDIQMAAIDDMDKRRNPRTLAPLGEPFIEKFIDKNGIEQEALVRETLEGGHVFGSKEFPKRRHNPNNIVAEHYSENRRTAPREWKKDPDGVVRRQVNSDEWQLLQAAKEVQTAEGTLPTKYIASMSKLAQDEPELKPRLEHLFKRMGFQLDQSP